MRGPESTYLVAGQPQRGLHVGQLPPLQPQREHDGGLAVAQRRGQAAGEVGRSQGGQQVKHQMEVDQVAAVGLGGGEVGWW